MITFIAHLRVPPENAEAYEALMAYVAEQTRANEPGVLWYDYARAEDDPETWVVVEVYRDAEAQAAHMATPWVRESLPRSLALIEGRPQIRQYLGEGRAPVTQRVKF